MDIHNYIFRIKKRTIKMFKSLPTGQEENGGENKDFSV